MYILFKLLKYIGTNSLLESILCKVTFDLRKCTVCPISYNFSVFFSTECFYS